MRMEDGRWRIAKAVAAAVIAVAKREHETDRARLKSA
jgi:hypothetical protein